MTTSAEIDPKLLEILVCPLTKGPLEYDRVAGELISRKAGLAYPIRDGIPVMLVEEGARWKDTPIDALPVPPPAAEPVADIRAAEAATSQNPTTMPDYRLLLAAGAILLFLLAVLTLGRKRSTGQQSLPPAT